MPDGDRAMVNYMCYYSLIRNKLVLVVFFFTRQRNLTIGMILPI